MNINNNKRYILKHHFNSFLFYFKKIFILLKKIYNITIYYIFYR